MNYVYLVSNTNRMVKIKNSHILDVMNFTHPRTKSGDSLYLKLLKKVKNNDTFKLTKVNAITEFLSKYDACRVMLNNMDYSGLIDREGLPLTEYRITEIGKKYLDIVNDPEFKNFELKKGVYLVIDSILVSNDKNIKDKDTIDLRGNEIKEFLEDNPMLEFRQVECIY